MTKFSPLLWATSIAGGILLVACSSVSTWRGSLGEDKGAPGAPFMDSRGRVTGIVYYLPRGLVTITGGWKKADPDSADPATVEKKSEPPAAGSHAAPAGAVTDGTPNPAPTPSSSPAPAPQPDRQYVITVSTSVEADAEHPRYARREANYFCDDEVRLTVDKTTRLLSTGNATSEDKTADILGTVAEIAVSSVVLFGAAPTPTPGPVPLLPFTVSFYPDNDGSVERARLKMAAAGFEFKCPSRSIEAPFGAWDWATKKGRSTSRIDGIAFRDLVAFTLKIEAKKNTSNIILDASKTVLLPGQKSAELIMDYGRMPFVKKVTEVTFVDGVPQDVHVTVPSPVLGFLQIPKSILKALIPIPGTDDKAASAGGGSSSGAAKPAAAAP